MDTKNNGYRYYLMIISSMLIFGTIGIFRRYIPLSSGVLAFTRGILGALSLIIFVKLKKEKLFHNIGKKNLLLLILSGGLIGFNWIFLFEAYNYTSVATATLCYYMQPTIVIFAAPFLLKEHLSIKKIICALISVIGMIFISGVFPKGLGSKDELIGIIFGLAAAALYASVVILNKKIFVEDAYEKTVIQLSSASIILVPYLLITEDFTNIEINSTAIITILILGIIHTGIAYALYFGSMKGLKGQSIAVLSYIDPVSALILSALVLKENMTIYGIIGAFLIIGSALISEITLKKKS